MRKKGIIAAGLMLIMSIGLCTTGFAADLTKEEQALLDSVKVVTLDDGTKLELPEKYVQQAEQFLATNDLTDAAIKDAQKKVEEVKAVVKESGATSIADLKAKVAADTALASKLATAVNAAGSAVGVELKADFTGGNVNYALKDQKGDTIVASGNVIKKTGFDLAGTVAIAVIGMAVLGGCVAIARKNELFA